jgi:uncharacterized short protein YbdD (DUF466 family)
MRPHHARLARVAAAARLVARTLRTVMGAPDYDRYVAHLRRRHPGHVPMPREEFVRERLDARYSKPGARCC